MQTKTYTFENLPQAVGLLVEKLERIEAQLQNIPKHHAEPKDKLLTVQEAADFLCLAPPTIYAMVSRGELPVMKRSKRLYFSEMELLEYLKEGRQKTKADIEADAENYLQKKKG
jgi:excisionase family DNA binding protein